MNKAYKSIELINNIYKDVSAEIGQLEIQKSNINERLQELKAQVSALNTLVPQMRKIEDDIQDKAKESESE